MRLEDLTHLGRPVDVEYPTNRAIAIVTGLSLAGFLAWRLVAGEAFPDALASAGRSAIAVFLAWALAREVDPVGERAAYVGTALAVVALVVVPAPPDLAAAFWTLFVLRVVNRTTGERATWLDTLLLLGLTAWGAFDALALVGGISAVAFALDGFLPPAPLVRHRVAAIVAAAVGVASWFVGPPDYAVASLDPRVLGGAVLLGGIAFVVRVVVPGPGHAVADVGSGPLDARRVRSAQLLALVLLGCTASVARLEPFLPLLCAVLGAGLGPRR